MILILAVIILRGIELVDRCYWWTWTFLQSFKRSFFFDTFGNFASPYQKLINNLTQFVIHFTTKCNFSSCLDVVIGVFNFYNASIFYSFIYLFLYLLFFTICQRCPFKNWMTILPTFTKIQTRRSIILINNNNSLAQFLFSPTLFTFSSSQFIRLRRWRLQCCSTATSSNYIQQIKYLCKRFSPA